MISIVYKLSHHKNSFIAVLTLTVDRCAVWLLVYGFVNMGNATIRQFVELYTLSGISHSEKKKIP